MFVKQIGSSLYVCKKRGYSRLKAKSPVYTWHLIKYHNHYGIVPCANIYFPKELIGKKIMLKVEVL